MDMTCMHCGKPVYQTGINFRDKVTGEVHFDGNEIRYECKLDYTSTITTDPDINAKQKTNILYSSKD